MILVNFIHRNRLRSQELGIVDKPKEFLSTTFQNERFCPSIALTQLKDPDIL